MKLTECMKRISEEYANGTIDFYASLKEDPWQKALDHYELETKMDDADTEHLFNTLINLNNVFKQLHIQPKRVDFIYHPDVMTRERREEIQSTIENACARCGCKKDLIMKRNSKYESYLVCKDCE